MFYLFNVNGGVSVSWNGDEVFVIEAGVYRIAPTTILVKDLPTVIVA
jgi:predicted HAD superfamily phosphohydrolase